MKLLMRAGPPENYSVFNRKLGVVIGPDFRTVEAFDEESGRVLAAAGYHNWTPTSCEMHTWVDEPRIFLSRKVLHAVFGYPFLQGGKRVVYTLTPGDNERSLAFQKALGFTELSRISDGWGEGVPLVLNILRRENCIWIRRPPVAINPELRKAG